MSAKLGNVAFSGAVMVYRFEGAGSSWVPFGQVITGTAANDLLGSALSLYQMVEPLLLVVSLGASTSRCSA